MANIWVVFIGSVGTGYRSDRTLLRSIPEGLPTVPITPDPKHGVRIGEDINEPLHLREGPCIFCQ